MQHQYLTRDEFRRQGFERSHGLCCVPDCGQPATEVHHIVERRLWQGEGYEGGYFLANAAAVCNPHHYQCEQTVISCDQLREWCGIDSAIYPPNIEPPTDKWGNPLLENNKRGIGPLFFDPSVQKILNEFLYDGTFIQRSKYGRTPHLPWSMGVTKTHDELDDQVLDTAPWLNGENIVLTEKMDGENTTMYHGEGNIHARSLDGRSHFSRSRVKAIHARIRHDIPLGMRIVGENMQAVHSLKYVNVPPFLVFAIFESTPYGWACLSWNATTEWCALLDLPMVPELYRGPWDEKLLRAAYDWREDDTLLSVYSGGNGEREGYVVRTAERFLESKLALNVAKFVRPQHVRTDRHWAHRQIEENILLKS